jgi:surface antigen
MRNLSAKRWENVSREVSVKQKNIIDFIKKHRTIKVLHIFRNYSAFVVVVSSGLLVSATNLAAGRESSGFLFGYFGAGESYESPIKDMFLVKGSAKENAALVPLAEARTVPNFDGNKEEAEELMMIEGESLVATTSPVKKDPKEEDGVEIYEVKDGDTLGSIAVANRVSVNTLMWANEIDDVNSIMPGDKLFILPVSGLNYVVKSGDSIDSIASKYKAQKDRIIAFNDLPATGDLKEGQEIIIPDGEKEIPRPVATGNQAIVPVRPYESFGSTGKVPNGQAGAGHKFPYGYCTWYVAQKKFVPWGGNAGTWLYNAKAAGYSTGKTPRVGSIIVTSESWWGHVGIVEKVSGDQVTISEMNYKGWAKKNTRTLSAKARVVKGFIYY